MPASADLLARVDDPRKLKGAETPYHRFDFNPYTSLQLDSPVRIAGKFLGRLLNPDLKASIEGAYSDSNPNRQLDTHYFTLQGKLPTFVTRVIWWQDQAVDLGSLFNRATTFEPSFRRPEYSNTALKRSLQIDPVEEAPYIRPLDAELGIPTSQNTPTVLRGIHAEPFIYKEGSRLKGEDPTRAVVTIETQTAIGYLDERIKEIEHANEERLQRLLMEKDAAERELAGHQFKSAESLRHLQEARARIANPTP